MFREVVIFTIVITMSVAQQYAGKPATYSKLEEIKYPPQPYNFAYDSKDDYGATQFRKESGDNSGRVTGSYGFKDEQGIERIVEYVADENGYRAQVKTNEPGTESKSPANVELYANPIVINYVPKQAGKSIAYAAPAKQKQAYAATEQASSYSAYRKDY